MKRSTLRSLLAVAAPALVVCAWNPVGTDQDDPAIAGQEPEAEPVMLVQYLEVVTPEVDATCAALAEMHGVTFGEAEPGLGSARTAALKSGGRIGVRAPLRPDEEPVVRPYVLVSDITAALKVAEDAGAEVAVGPTEIPGHGTFAIYFQGGIQHGLWQL